MSTLDTKNKNEGLKTLITYICVTIALLIFSIIYLKHSYGVDSIFMRYLSLIPAVGIIVFGVLYILNKMDKKAKKSRVAYNLFNASIFTLVIGSGLEGIFEICGAHSFYMWIYALVGGLLMFSSLVIFIYVNVKELKNKKKEPKFLKEKND